jgi:hypothetical protein
VNVASVLPVSPSSPSRSQVSSIAFLPGPAHGGQGGAFSSLLDRLVSKSDMPFPAGFFPAATVQQPPMEFADLSTAPVAAKSKPRVTKSGDNDAGTGKKGESKPKLALAQAIEGPPPPILMPPILFRALTWETQSQSIGSLHSPAPVDEVPEVHVENADPSFALSSEQATPIPEENEPASIAKIAFGLRLTVSHPEVSMATRSSAPDSQIGRVLDLNTLAPERAEGEGRSAQLSSARLTAGENWDASNVNFSALSDARMPVSDVSLASRGTESTLSNATDTSGIAGTGNGRVEDISTAIGSMRRPDPGPRIPVGEEPLEESKNDTKPVPDPSANVAPALILSKALPDPQAANFQIADDQIPNEQAGKQKAVPGNAAVSSSPDRDASRVAALVPEEVGPRLQQQQPVKEVGDAEAAPNAIRSETSRDNAVTGAPKGPAQASGGPDTTERRSAADPSRTLSRVTSSRAMSSQTISSETMSSQTVSSRLPQAISSQAAASQATGSESPAARATDVAIASEISAPPQPSTARQISLKLTGDDATKVSVDLSEKGGKVQVAVRTADPDLAKSLQTDLGDLVGRLEGKGFKTEAWVPAVSRHTPAAAPERSGSTNSQDDPRHSGSDSDQRQGRPGQNGSNQRQQARWIAQLEDTLSTEETGTMNE